MIESMNHIMQEGLKMIFLPLRVFDHNNNFYIYWFIVIHLK